MVEQGSGVAVSTGCVVVVLVLFAALNSGVGQFRQCERSSGRAGRTRRETVRSDRAPAWAVAQADSSSPEGKVEPVSADPRALPAVLSATAPTSTGPSAKPRSWSRFGAALAVPVRCRGTELTALDVIGDSVKAKPIPTISAPITRVELHPSSGPWTSPNSTRIRPNAKVICSATDAARASDAGKTAPAPRPLIAEPTHIHSTVGDTAHTSEPTMTAPAPPITNERCRYLSPRTPKVSQDTTTGIINAAVIHVSCDPTVPNVSWNTPLSVPGSAFAICATVTASEAAANVPRILCGARRVNGVRLGGRVGDVSLMPGGDVLTRAGRRSC